MVRRGTRGLINGYQTKGLSGPGVETGEEGKVILTKASGTPPYCIVLSTGLNDIMNL